MKRLAPPSIGALIIVATCVSATSAVAGSRAASIDQLSLKTGTQVKAFSKSAIIARVGVDASTKVTLAGSFTAGESDKRYRIGPVRRRVGSRGADFRLELGAKQREILAFAAETCAKTPLTLKARTRGGGPNEPVLLKTELRRPPSCDPESPAP